MRVRGGVCSAPRAAIAAIRVLRVDLVVDEAPRPAAAACWWHVSFTHTPKIHFALPAAPTVRAHAANSLMPCLPFFVFPQGVLPGGSQGGRRLRPRGPRRTNHRARQPALPRISRPAPGRGGGIPQRHRERVVLDRRPLLLLPGGSRDDVHRRAVELLQRRQVHPLRRTVRPPARGAQLVWIGERMNAPTRTKARRSTNVSPPKKQPPRAPAPVRRAVRSSGASPRLRNRVFTRKRPARVFLCDPRA